MTESKVKPAENIDNSPPSYHAGEFLSGVSETHIPPADDNKGQATQSEPNREIVDLQLPPDLHIVRKLDRGGMGEVYLVDRDSGMGTERLALKMSWLSCGPEFQRIEADALGFRMEQFVFLLGSVLALPAKPLPEFEGC